MVIKCRSRNAIRSKSRANSHLFIRDSKFFFVFFFLLRRVHLCVSFFGCPYVKFDRRNPEKRRKYELIFYYKYLNNAVGSCHVALSSPYILRGGEGRRVHNRARVKSIESLHGFQY